MNFHRFSSGSAPTRPSGSLARQRGSVLVAAAAAMAVSVVLLASADLGYLFYTKREFQKTADLAAMAGAQQIDPRDAACVDARAAAKSNAELNLKNYALVLDDGAITCGRWDPTGTTVVNMEPPTEFYGGVGKQKYFGQPDLARYAEFNAVKVVVSKAAPALLPFINNRQIEVEAIAFREPRAAAFSVGAQLLRVNGNTPLGRLLQSVGVDLDKTTVLDSSGLANVKVTPAGLLEALGIPVSTSLTVGDFNALLTAHKVSIENLLDASATLIANSGVAGVDLSLLRSALSAGLNITELNIPLGSNDGSPGSIFGSITAPSAASAMNAELSVAELLKTSIAIASAGRGVLVDDLNILGLVKARVGIVEPASIGIGGVGTKAFSSQVRVYLDIDSNNLLGGGLRAVTDLLGVRLHLPLYVDVVSAMGTLTEMNCEASPKTATINVESSILRACVGKVDPSIQFSTSDLCADEAVQDELLLKALHIPVVEDKLELNVLDDPQSLELEVGEMKSTEPNALKVGTAVTGLVDELLRVLSNILPQSGGSDAKQVAQDVAKAYLGASAGPTGRYDLDRAVALLKNGATNGLAPLGDWTVNGMVPRPCALGLATCWENGSVWTGFSSTVTGQGYGAVDGLLNLLLGGLLIKNCSGLVGQLLTYNSCVENNLASYLQTKPGGILTAGGATSSSSCGGLVCLLLKPVLALLEPVLNGVGSLLRGLLTSVLGIELGRTDVHLQSLSCGNARLVY